MSSLDVISLTVGLAAGVGATAVASWILARRSARPSPAPPFASPPETMSAAAPPRDPPAGVPPTVRPPPPEAVRVPTAAAPPARTATPRSELAGISERVLLHLQRLPSLSYGTPATLDRTQAGMCSRLDIRQGSLTRALTRLEASGAITARRGHVEGMGQRLKVYELTPLGEAVARTLRTRAGTASAGLLAGTGGGPRPPAGPSGPPGFPGQRSLREPAENSVEYIR